LSVDASVVKLEVVWHVGMPRLGSQAADFLIAGLECPCEVVDAGMGGGELLGSDGGASLHCGCESVGHGSCDFAEFIPTEADEGFG
jgi:hypothetical protein